MLPFLCCELLLSGLFFCIRGPFNWCLLQPCLIIIHSFISNKLRYFMLNNEPCIPQESYIRLNSGLFIKAQIIHTYFRAHSFSMKDMSFWFAITGQENRRHGRPKLLAKLRQTLVRSCESIVMHSVNGTRWDKLEIWFIYCLIIWIMKSPVTWAEVAYFSNWKIQMLLPFHLSKPIHYSIFYK